METIQLFRTDPYCAHFDATVRTCEPHGDRWIVVLDQTAFYPEGGGQSADTGRLDCTAVLDVQAHNGVIGHTVDAPLVPGERVSGVLDWEARFSRMQHHTGEHIVSGLVHRLHGLDNVGFHMGAAMVTVDFNGMLDTAALEEIERLANRTVFENLVVEQTILCADDPLVYRSKKALSGEVRIVTIPGADCCACCGTHVARTGEIGLIKLLSPQHYKGGTRVGILCGERARLDYGEKDGYVHAASARLSVKPSELSEAVSRIQAENARLTARLSAVQDALFSARCDAIGTGDAPICLFDPTLSPTEARRLSALLGQRRDGICGVFFGTDAAYRYALCARHTDLRVFTQTMHAALGGKGGGSSDLTQGTLPCTRDAIERYFGV